MGDDWHEFFEDFPEFDPANSDLTYAELEAKCAAAPGWEWVREAEERAARHVETAEPEDLVDLPNNGIDADKPRR